MSFVYRAINGVVSLFYSTPTEKPELANTTVAQAALPTFRTLTADGFYELSPKNEFGRAANTIIETNFDQVDYSFNLALEEIKTFKVLTKEEKEEFKPLLQNAYLVLQKATEKSCLEKELKRKIIETVAELRRNEVFLQQEEAILLSNISEIGKKIRYRERSLYENPIGKLLGLVKLEGVEGVKLAVKENSTTEEQAEVLKYLISVRDALEKSGITASLTNEELLDLKLIMIWLMTGYLSQQKSGLKAASSNFDLLFDINTQLDKLISARSSSDQESFLVDSSFIDAFAELKRNMKTSYPDQFWNNKSHLVHLKYLQSIMTGIVECIRNPQQIEYPGLNRIGEDSKTGLSLHQIKNSEDEYVLMLDGYDQTAKHYDYSQQRSGGGLGHAPVFDAVKEIKPTVEILLKDKTIHKLVLTGFGLNAAVLEVLAKDLARQRSDCNFIVYSVGTPPFLETITAADFLAVKNLYAMNFRENKDQLSRTSNLGACLKVAESYSDQNWQMIYPIYNRFWFLTDVTGHDRTIYADNMQRAIEQPLKMHEVYNQIDMLSQVNKEEVEVSEAPNKETSK